MSNLSELKPKRRSHASIGQDPTLVALGDQIRQKRIDNKLTQEELALVTGLGRELIMQLENGKAHISLGRASRVLAALGLSLQLVEC
ncbi:helix-turn-helix transcriptional regulator [Thiothrix eikelboomii]|uniref:helix-turn-helix transcriptional regulator n=1 Tax=Thiothrix eikelboomii TaxID=92487 RepID=UPI003BB1067F